MALADLVTETRTITVGENEFKVHGLSFASLSHLVTGGFREEIAGLIEILKPLLEGKENVDITEIIHELFPRAPTLSARLIAVAADAPDLWDRVYNLPIPVQLEALLAVGDLTFTGGHSLKNFVGDLTRLMTRATQTLAEVSKSKQVASIGGTD